ncbi:phage tail assembly protein T [Pseudomonas typographi]|uniref:phage tail assembly protein T n=1 Tax=Pseudomonas typographi TaxID=2715964 RepID=UPI0016898490|nr:hypothetical protein [Pseudomonas typographi]MBD1553636.1 hypothetical protein [Pseudomonas typographi]
MSYAEMLAWAAYREKHGSFNSMQRQEQMGAIVALQVNRLRGGDAALIDFMPHAERPPISLEQAMEEWV